MIVYLAGTNKKQIESLQSPISVLESFAYMKKHADTIDLLLANNFILDSGAFTFIGQNKKMLIGINIQTNILILLISIRLKNILN